jgi:hypothetical protein
MPNYSLFEKKGEKLSAMNKISQNGGARVNASRHRKDSFYICIAGLLSAGLLTGLVACGFSRARYHPQPSLGAPNASSVEKRTAYMATRRPRSAAFSYAREDGLADIHALFAAVERIHPNHLSAFTSAGHYDELKKAAMAWVERLCADGRISSIDLALIAHYCLASFGDGHTAMHMKGEAEGFLYRAEHWPPFVLGLRDGVYIVAAATDETVAAGLRPGSAIRTIEGQPISEFLEPAFLAIPAETDAWRDHAFLGRQDFYYSLLDLLGERSTLHIGLDDGREYRVSCVQAQVFASLFEEYRRSLGDRSAQHGSLYSPAEGIVVFNYAAFDISATALARIDQVMAYAGAINARHLIIDLRNNGGGNSSAGDYLIDYVWAEPYRQFRAVEARYSTDVMDAFGYNPLMIGAKNGSVVRYEGTMRKPKRREPFFSGQLHVVTGPGTFSSASDFAATVQDFSMGELWGYETGGARSCHGDVFSTRLPGTGWPFGVSWKTFYAPVERPGEFTRGVIPDHLAIADLLSPFKGKSDLLMAWVINELVTRDESAPTSQ